MSAALNKSGDPAIWHIAATLAFLGLCLIRIAVPSAPYFDEVHYLPAARALLELSQPLNIEHPPLGKQIIALGMALFGDSALGWRIMPVLAGACAMLAAMRAMWFASGGHSASLLTGFFLATGFPLFVQARIAMLDIFMAAFIMLALWMCAAAMRQAEQARWRLAIAGAALGAAMACKWNALPLAMLPGIAFLAIRLRHAGWHFIDTRRGAPVPGMALAEAAFWLGLMPLTIYAAAYWPAFFYASGAISPYDLAALHRDMIALQQKVIDPHTYQSVWYEWAANWRAIWYLYEDADGAQRGILLVGNPMTMLAGLPALAWCLWAGLRQKGRRHDCLAVAVLYAVSLGLWIIAPKPVQFYHHYFLPSCFLLAALALAVAALWEAKSRLIPAALCLGSAAMFAYFHPILSAAPLANEQAFLRWAWLASWR